MSPEYSGVFELENIYEQVTVKFDEIGMPHITDQNQKDAYTAVEAGGLLRTFFSVGPFETIGGNEVINNQIFDLESTGICKVKAGPSTKRVVDFADVENSLSILPTGQSGNVFSKSYKDQTKKYLDGKFVQMHLNLEGVKNDNQELILKPK